MIPAERRNHILALLQDKEFISINDLTENLGVSHMTIRRDLQRMETEGLIKQVSGGAQILRRLLSEPSHSQKEMLCAAEKDAIGRYAAGMIPANCCIYLDAGTTSLALCAHIYERADLTIVSNDFEVINYLISHNCQSGLIHTGGQVQKQNRSGIGHLAAQTIASLSIDLGFLSASSWELRGITTPDPGKVPVKQAVVKSSRQRILICDSSKYAQTATYLAVPISDINTIITDDKLPEHGQRMLANMDLKLIMV
ncbi:MAG: DeoR/GlpR transcriptional regulator [Proteobacteria bacterium]|uniref:DeoR/GlpR transcriptional regulator n=1 Tax=Candidatus Avisuccinivibrio stercorigallinarum TaxID=2840704 RepID=A0A9D9DAD9_9GAMM|nr:DeoR/GlpR transcriptional regulator [Candidatus Avisuccinivibrio stercorigallinarum]